jgi:DNA transformation protein
MAVSDSFVEFVLEQLEPVGAITPKRMFGGVGVYAGDLFFALLDNDVLYLKVNDSNRADFEAAGARPFRPYGPGGEVMQYYEVPVGVLEDADELGRWAAKSIAVARAKKTSKPRRAAKKKPARPVARVKRSRSRTPSKRASSSAKRPGRRKNRRR